MKLVISSLVFVSAAKVLRQSHGTTTVASQHSQFSFVCNAVGMGCSRFFSGRLGPVCIVQYSCSLCPVAITQVPEGGENRRLPPNMSHVSDICLLFCFPPGFLFCCSLCHGQFLELSVTVSYSCAVFC